MKLRLCFFMLALGICGAVVQGCDDNDDNLDVLDKLQAAFSQKYPEASPKWKTRSNYYIADFQNQNYAAELVYFRCRLADDRNGSSSCVFA